MKLDIPYGKERKVSVEVDEKHIAGVIEPNAVEISDEAETIRRGIDNALNSKNFDEFIAEAKDILFIVNDHTRPTPTNRVLDVIWERIKERDIRFIIATGAHRSPDEEEFNFIFGKYYSELKGRIHVHDARKDEDMVYLGTSSTGTVMEVNRLGVEADRLIIIGSVEPHYFAGYTGGRKSFLPGIASYRTIEQNHRHALKPEAKGLALEGNPVNEDMLNAIKTIEEKRIFSIQTVLDGERRIYSCSAGNIRDSFFAAIDRAHKVFCVDIKEKADIVVSVAGYPSDVDLYQAQKALDNGALALRDGGIIILVAECRGGIGDEAYFNLLCRCKTPGEALERIKEGYRLGYHKAAKMAEISGRAQIRAVTDLEPKLLEGAFIESFSSIQEALDRSISEKGEKASVVFLMDGSLTVPKITG